MKALLVYSGGMDSTVLLHEYKDEVKLCVSFNYGSKHNDREFAAAKANADALNIPIIRIDLPFINEHFKSDLLKSGGEIPDGHYEHESMKRTVVPFRNGIMLSIAAGLAESHGLEEILIANHAGDHCLPADSPVLTSAGLKNIADLVEGDEVMSFDATTKGIVWRPITAVVEKGVPPTVLEIVTKSGCKLRCTSEHKIFVIEKTDWTRKKGWQKKLALKKAKDLKIGDVLLSPGQTIDTGKSKRTKIDLAEDVRGPMLAATPNATVTLDTVQVGHGNILPRFVNFDDYIKLVCWYVTEGAPGNGNTKKPNRYGVYIAQSSTANPDDLKEIMRLALAWGFHPKVHGSGTNTSVFFSGASAKAMLDCGRSSRGKRLPEWFLSLDNASLRVIFETLILGDGYEPTDDKDRFSYITTSQELIRQVAYIGNRLGYKTSVSKTLADDCFNVSFYRSVARPNLNRFGGAAMSSISSIKTEANDQAVYDITVDGTHSFFSGDTTAALVSNSIYPDCRAEFIQAMDMAFLVGTAVSVELCAPYTHITKRDIALKGRALGVDFTKTYSCYKGGEVHCGQCGTCVERREACEGFDTTIYQ